MTITAILPAFNEEVSIGNIVLHTLQHASRVIVVDDGSKDRTAEMAQLAGAEVIRHSTKMGKDAALNSGFNIAVQNNAKIIVIIDIDGHYDPDMIPEAINHIKNEGYDMVVSSSRNNGKPYDKKSLLLQHKKTSTTEIEFLVFPTAILNKIDITYLNGPSIRDILSRAEKSRFKIKYQNFEKESNLNQFNGYNIGIVVPAYNEEQLIEETINGIPGYVKRIYIIDDCSTDHTPEIIKYLTDPRIVSIRHEKNRGVGGAIITGYKLALEDDMDIVAVMAGDNQMDPGQLSHMLNPIVEGKADFTKGNRISRGYWEGMSKWRLLGNFLLTWLNKIASGYWNISDPQNGYVAISVSSLCKFNLDSLYERFAFENDMMIQANMLGIRMINVTIPARYGEEKSKIKYSTFIVDTSWFLLKSFLLRVCKKYIKEHNPIGILYLLSFILILTGIPLIFLLSLVPFVIGMLLFLLACSLEKWQNKERR